MPGVFVLFAQAAVDVQGDEATRRTFELGRVLSFGLLEWLLLILVAVVVFALVIYFYIRDCVEVGGILATVLITLRMGAFAGLLWIYLLPQMRIEKDEQIHSKVVMLVDTSLSMGKKDEGSSKNRIDQVVEKLNENDKAFLNRLRKVHDVVVMTFDSEPREVAVLDRLPGPDASGKPAPQTDQPSQAPPDWAQLLRPRGVKPGWDRRCGRSSTTSTASLWRA